MSRRRQASREPESPVDLWLTRALKATTLVALWLEILGRL